MAAKPRKRAAAKRAKRPKKTATSTSEGPLLKRVRTALSGSRGITEKRMFGGSCFMLRGNMSCGVTNTGVDLMVRVGPDAHAETLGRKHARPMDITGRPMKGFVFVDPAGTRTTAQVARWIELGVGFARTLPAK